MGSEQIINNVFWAIFSAFFGALLAIIFTIVVECKRKPKIVVCSPSISEGTYSDGTKAKTAGLAATNKMLPRFMRWIDRRAAVNAYGYIDFYDEENKKFAKKRMPIKWSYEPGLESVVGNFILVRRFRDVSFVDIHPGEVQLIDVASKYDEDKVIYGWTYENYFSQPQWRNPKWQIDEGQYVVGVEIRYGGDMCRHYFRLHNKNGSFEFFACNGNKREFDKIWETLEEEKSLSHRVYKYDEINVMRTNALSYILGALFLVTLPLNGFLDWVNIAIGIVFFTIAIVQLVTPFIQGMETCAKKLDRTFSGMLYLVTLVVLITDVINRFRDKHTLIFWAVLSCLILLVFLIVQDVWFSVKRALEQVKELGLKSTLNSKLKRLSFAFAIMSLLSFAKNTTIIIPPVWWVVLSAIMLIAAYVQSRVLKRD